MKRMTAALAVAAAMTVAHGANAAVTVFQSSGNTLKVKLEEIALPGAGQYAFNFTSSVTTGYQFQVVYEEHYDYYLAPAPRPHNETLDGNSGYVTGYTSGVGTGATWLYTVPELSRTYFPASVNQSLAFGIPVGTPLYRETHSDDPVFSFYLNYAGGEPFDYTFTITRVSAIPEPATWSMMILGFAFAGAALRHARRSTGRNTWQALQG